MRNKELRSTECVCVCAYVFMCMASLIEAARKKEEIESGYTF